MWLEILHAVGRIHVCLERKGLLSLLCQAQRTGRRCTGGSPGGGGRNEGVDMTGRITGRFYSPAIYRNIAGWLRRRSGESHRQPLYAWHGALWGCRESRSAGVLRGIVLCCLVLVLPACGETDPRIPVVQEIAAVNLDSLRNLADDTTLVFEGCASSPRLEPVTAFTARRLRALGFDCAVRTVDRSVQRPTGFHTGEAQDLVAWRLPAERHDTLPDLHLGVFYEASASEPTGLSPLARISQA